MRARPFQTLSLAGIAGGHEATVVNGLTVNGDHGIGLAGSGLIAHKAVVVGAVVQPSMVTLVPVVGMLVVSTSTAAGIVKVPSARYTLTSLPPAAMAALSSSELSDCYSNLYSTVLTL